jgi:hypothetical protein
MEVAGVEPNYILCKELPTIANTKATLDAARSYRLGLLSAFVSACQRLGEFPELSFTQMATPHSQVIWDARHPESQVVRAGARVTVTEAAVAFNRSRGRCADPWQAPGSVSAHELGHGRSDELRDTLRGLPETAAASAGAVKGQKRCS